MSRVVKRTFNSNFETIAAVAVSVSVIIGLWIAVSTDKVCLTDVCQEVSVAIKNGLKTEVDPCQDFYDFACGNMLDDIEKTFESESIILTVATERQRETLKKMLMEHSYRASIVSRKVQEFMSMCEQAGLLVEASKEIPETAADSLFPSVVGKEFNEKTWNLLTITGKLREIGLDFSSLFKIALTYEPLNPRKIILSVRNPKNLNYSLTECNKACAVYYVQQYLHTISAFTKNAREAKKDAQDVMDFEKKIITNAIKYQEVQDDSTLVNCTKPLSTLNDSYVFVDWMKYIKIVLGNITSTMNVTGDMRILVLNGEYLTQLTKLFSETSPRVMANYMMWYALRPLNTKSCISWVEETMPITLQKTYLEMYSSDRRSIAIQEMVHFMRENIIQWIWKVDWFDEKDKGGAANHINETYLRLARSDSLNQFDTDKFYQGIDLGGDLRFLLNMNRYLLDKKLNLLVTGVDRESWDLILFVFDKKIYSVDRFYIPEENSVTILDGFLKQPVHHEDWPPYLNYGRLGTAVGHMLTHALSFENNNFDKEGRPKNWWVGSTREKFNTKNNCFRNQFSKLTSSDEILNYTNREFIADSSSLQVGLEAYRKLLNSSIFPDLLLPDLPYTQEQLYFISFAQLHCSNNLNPIKKNLMPSERLRVVGSVQNSKDFGEAFGCKINSVMNPQTKCIVWD